MQGQERDVKLNYFRELLRCCSRDELRGLKGLINIAEKRSRPQPRLTQIKRRRSHLTSVSAAPVSSVAAPVSAETEEGYWWEEFKQEVVSFDVEMVTLFEKGEDGKHINAPATVAVSDYEEENKLNVSS